MYVCMYIKATYKGKVSLVFGHNNYVVGQGS